MSKDFKRRKKYRPIKSTFLVVCEGSCEKIYFENLKRKERLSNIKIDIYNPKRSTPSEICKYAKKKQEERDYDMAFCIVDGDALKQGDLKQGPKIEFIISTPCFEIWFLLHYKFTAKEFNNCAGLITHELKKYIPDYQKSQNYQKKKNFYEMLKENFNGKRRTLQQAAGKNDE